MFHYPNIDFVKIQSKAINLPLIFKKTKGEKEHELKDLEKAIKEAIEKYKIKGLISGALASNYQKSRIDKICKKLKIKSIPPLWHINLEDYIKDLIKNKFEVIITGISADGLDKSFLRRKINYKFLEDIKKLKIHIVGEGGEYETFVLDAPFFKKHLSIERSSKIMESEFCGILDIKKMKLITKNI